MIQNETGRDAFSKIDIGIVGTIGVRLLQILGKGIPVDQILFHRDAAPCGDGDFQPDDI